MTSGPRRHYHQTRRYGNQKASLALPAFFASAAGTQMIQASMLGDSFTDTDGVMETLSLRWSEETQSPIPDGNCARKQSQWDGPLTRKEALTLLAGCVDEYHRARLRAASAAHAGEWVLALPLTACGLRLDDEAIRIAACLLLEARTCEPHICLAEGWSRQTAHTVCLAVSVQADSPGTGI